jgi:hypothetical protein
MKTGIGVLAGSLCLGGLAALLGQSTSAVAAQPAQTVVVTNPVSLNPATSNPVVIANPGPVPVTLSGAAVTRNADRPSAQPVYLSCNLITPERTCAFNYTVPSGKTLIVTNVSYQMQYPLSDSRLTAVTLCSNGCGEEYFLPVAPTLNNVPNEVSTNGSTVSFGTATQLFFRAGESIQAFYQMTPQNPAFSIEQQINVAGHLEDTP